MSLTSADQNDPGVFRLPLPGEVFAGLPEDLETAGFASFPFPFGALPKTAAVANRDSNSSNNWQDGTAFGKLAESFAKRKLFNGVPNKEMVERKSLFKAANNTRAIGVNLIGIQGLLTNSKAFPVVNF